MQYTGCLIITANLRAAIMENGTLRGQCRSAAVSERPAAAARERAHFENSKIIYMLTRCDWSFGHSRAPFKSPPPSAAPTHPPPISAPALAAPPPDAHPSSAARFP